MYHTIIIGAGQAGLAMGYYLAKLNHSFLILDAGQEVGEVWSKRYDSLVLFTPRLYNALPGLEFEGYPHGFPTKDEVSRYLKAYAETFQLPIKHHSKVTSVQKEDNIFLVSTDKKNYQARSIVIATGPFHKPIISTFAYKLSTKIVQLHSSNYDNPSQLQNGTVLVVGGGNSGAQIAVEIAREKKVYLSTSRPFTFLPLKVGGRSTFWWFDKLGILKINSTSFIGKQIQKRADPIFGFELKEAIKNGTVHIKGRATDSHLGSILFEDNTALSVQNIIWATGFKPDYSWVHIHDAFNEKGKPIHHRGITNIQGLYFLGLPWQYRRGSALLQGVGYDAAYIMGCLQSE